MLEQVLLMRKFARMRKINPFVQIMTGALLVVLITNDFIPLLVEYLFDISGFKLPIKFSPEGWKVKFWMMDHQPAFALYQVLFMGTGFLLMFSAAFRWLSTKLMWGIIGGLTSSALLVLLAPGLHYLVQETPAEFMYAQLLAGLALIPIALNKTKLKQVQNIAIYTAAGLCLLLVVFCILKSTITLRYAVFPLIGTVYLIFSLQKTSK